MILKYSLSYIYGVHFDGPSYLIGTIPFIVGLGIAIFMEELVYSIVLLMMSNDSLAKTRAILSGIILSLFLFFAGGLALLFYYQFYLGIIRPEIIPLLINISFGILIISLLLSLGYTIIVLFKKEQNHSLGGGGFKGFIIAILLFFFLKFFGLEHYDPLLIVILFTGLGFLCGTLGRREILLQKWNLLIFPVEQGLLISFIFNVFFIWLFRYLYGIDFKSERFLALLGLFISAISVILTTLYSSRLIRKESFETSPYKKRRYLRMGFLIFLFFWIGEIYSILTVQIE